MLFRESFITDKGAELLARATAQGGQIVWTSAKTSNCNTDGDSASTMNHMTDIVKTEQDSYTSSGSVTNAIVLPPSANDDGSQSSAAIFCELTNETYDGLARTFGAWAKIQGDQTDVLAIVARCGTGVTPTYINPVSEGLVKAFVDFTLKVNAEQAQAVQSAEGYYATATALNTEVYAREQADSRMVTTHSATSTTDGDDQTILGTKTFSSGIVANGGVSATTLSTSGNVTIRGILAVTEGYTSLGYLNTAEIVPKITSTSDDTGWALGSSTHRWKEIIVRNGDFSGALSVTGNTTVGGTLDVTGTTALLGNVNVGGSVSTEVGVIIGTEKPVGFSRVITSGATRLDVTMLDSVATTVMTLKDDAGTVTMNVPGTGTFQELQGLLSSLYSSGKGAIVRIHIVGTTTGTFDRGSEIFDGYSGTIGSLTVTSDEYNVTSASRFRLLHKTIVSTSGVDADAVVTVA